jgi:hypothetical protein
MTYLVIGQFGEAIKTEDLTPDLLKAAEEGYLMIVNTSNMTLYFEGRWDLIMDMGE